MKEKKDIIILIILILKILLCLKVVILLFQNVAASCRSKKYYTDLEKEINECKNFDKTDINNKEDIEYKSKKNNFWNFLIYAITFKNKKII